MGFYNVWSFQRRELEVLLYLFIDGTIVSCPAIKREAADGELAPTYRHVLFHIMLQILLTV